MDISSLLESLNSEQREAVSTERKHTLVIAGAGSGKTRVLEHRVAWHVFVHGMMPSQIMAVTFTNKSASELRHRIERTLKHRAPGMLAGTFHSLSHRLLRQYHEAAGLHEQFLILDTDDTLRALKKTMEALNLDESRFQVKSVHHAIQQAKEQRITADMMPEFNLYQKQLKHIYTHYTKLCRAEHWLDFSDLLLKTIELLKNPEIRHALHERIHAILVDEFQDINPLQYAWLECFFHEKIYSMCVGDDDQSIYSWRGARADLMTHYAKQLPDVLTLRLEQNYRSSPVILEAANHVIARNEGRLGKNLWTESTEGPLIDVFHAFSDLDEARYVTESAQQAIESGVDPASIAILYRSNAQSRLFEEQCHALGIPYRIYAGQRFFDRQEIKDVLAYLRLSFFPHDNAAMERVIQTPPRGIGHTSLAKLRSWADAHQASLWEAIQALRAQPEHGRMAQALSAFYEEITELNALTQSLSGRALAEAIVTRVQLIPYLRRSEKEHANKCENIEELFSAIDQFCQEEHTVLSFLQHAALMHGDDGAQTHNSLVLMTLHAAKGLEFDYVFLVGVEEELLPHKASLDDPAAIQEERRLCYVGITRARKKLSLSYCESRKLYGQSTYQRPSRFISEIPASCLHMVRHNRSSHRTHKQNSYQAGQSIHHPKYGLGEIILVEGSAPHMRVRVDFESVGCKWFLAEYMDF